MVVADPEGVQLGADAQPFGGRQASDLRPLGALRIGMAGEYAYASIDEAKPTARPLVCETPS